MLLAIQHRYLPSTGEGSPAGPSGVAASVVVGAAVGGVVVLLLVALVGRLGVTVGELRIAGCARTLVRSTALSHCKLSDGNSSETFGVRQSCQAFFS